MTDTAPPANAPRALAGKTALITGGTGGIGLHTARGLAAVGACVIVTGRDPNQGAEAATQIHAHAGGHDQVSFLQADHATVGANHDLAGQLADCLEGLDVLVNNVGRVFAARHETADGYEAAHRHLPGETQTAPTEPRRQPRQPAARHPTRPNPRQPSTHRPAAPRRTPPHRPVISPPIGAVSARMQLAGSGADARHGGRHDRPTAHSLGEAAAAGRRPILAARNSRDIQRGAPGRLRAGAPVACRHGSWIALSALARVLGDVPAASGTSPR
jgi:hypothetical protein